jgi:hypothetical protein
MLVDIAVKFTYRSRKLLRNACWKTSHGSGPSCQAKAEQLFVVIRILSPGAQKPDPTTIRANPSKPSPENRPVEYRQPIEYEPICLVRSGKYAGPGEMGHLDHRTNAYGAHPGRGSTIQPTTFRSEGEAIQRRKVKSWVWYHDRALFRCHGREL